MSTARDFILDRVVVECRAYLDRCADCPSFAKFTAKNGVGNRLPLCVSHWQSRKAAYQVFGADTHRQCSLVEALEALGDIDADQDGSKADDR